jgi:hypothetical protein
MGTIYLIEMDRHTPRVDTIRKLMVALEIPFDRHREVFPEGKKVWSPKSRARES